MNQTLRCAASPSLALVKYWGKADGGINLPATTSIAVTVSHLETVSQVSLGGDRANEAAADEVFIEGEPQPESRFAPFFAAIREALGEDRHFRVESVNTFPTGAGLASSSSGFAALATGCTAVAGKRFSGAELSALARVGSGSAARAVFGGFTRFTAGASFAEQIADENHWPELRIVIAVVQRGSKPISSRDAMIRSRDTSPYYADWVSGAEALAGQAETAVHNRDLETLGRTMRQSYLRMFSTMFTAEPPVIFWLPESVAIIRACEQLRADGIPAWETMDAGPQVKVLTTADHTAQICDRLHHENPSGELLVVGVGSGPRLLGTGAATASTSA